MKSRRAATWGILLGLLLSAAFLVDSLIACRIASDRRDRAAAKLNEARSLARSAPSVFAQAPTRRSGMPLKTLVRELGSRWKLGIGYLSESDKDAGRGRRERQVLVRLMGAPHENLVNFLKEVERDSGGALVKEVHLRPSEEATGVYQEVEAVFSALSWSGEGVK